MSELSYIPRSSLSCSNSRGDWGELTGEGVSKIIDFLKPALPATFCDFDRKGRGDSLNISLYAWDADQSVGVVQVRHAFRLYKNSEFLNVHKTYVLCGFNENGEPFRHPVSAHTVRAACKKSVEAGVIAAQQWMWRVTAKQLEASRRQGDILPPAPSCAPRDAPEPGTLVTKTVAPAGRPRAPPDLRQTHAQGATPSRSPRQTPAKPTAVGKLSP